MKPIRQGVEAVVFRRLPSLGPIPIRSPYLERFWLPVIGPSSAVLLRRADLDLAAGKDGAVSWAVADLAAVLGLRQTLSANGPAVRTLTRVCLFGLAQAEVSSDPTLTVLIPPSVPLLGPGRAARLPGALREEHEAWIAAYRGEPARP